MKRDLKKRLAEAELKASIGPMADLSGLDLVDYDNFGGPYTDPPWQELAFDDWMTVARHRETGEVRGYCKRRIPLEELDAEHLKWL